MGQRSRILAILLLIAASSGISDAGPRVSVRGRAQIELDPVRRLPDGIEVSGRLLERASGDPIGFAGISVSIDGIGKELYTRGDGTFEVQALADPSSTHDIAISFPGDSQYSGAIFEIADLDVKKRPLLLELDIGDPIAVDDPGELQVTATSQGEPVQIPVTIELIRPPDGAEPYTVAITDDDGDAAVALAADRLGAPGRLRFRASFDGDPNFDAAEVEIDTTLRSDTSVIMRLRDDSVAFGDDLVARGELVDSRGMALAGQLIALQIDGQEVASAATDNDGSFRIAVRTSILEPETTVSVQAVFSSQVSHLRSSRSQPYALAVGVRKPIPVRYTLAAFGVATVMLMVFVALRTRPWQRWLDALRPRSDAERGEGAAERGDVAPHTGLAPARPSLRMTLRRASDRGFAGVVQCAVSNRPIAGARVTLRGGSAVVETETGSDGAFELTADSDGDHAAEVGADGYVTERFGVTFPHRGELRGARVDLLPVREKIFELYRQVAEPVLPRSGLWGLWTPRQIVDHVRGDGGDRPALAALTDYVEDAYFSQRVPLEAALPEAAQMVEAARRESTHSL